MLRVSVGNPRPDTLQVVAPLVSQLIIDEPPYLTKDGLAVMVGLPMAATVKLSVALLPPWPSQAIE